MATYVIGDIQACISPVKQLLKEVGFNNNKDQLIAVGDLIGRGPDALETIEFLISLGNSFKAVLGNHDLHFLAVAAGLKKHKPADKFDSLLSSQQLPQIIDWLRNTPLALKVKKNTLITHAGLYPKWTFAQVLEYANKVHVGLSGPNWQSILKNMYGNKINAWDPSSPELEQQIFTINALTRMRYLHPDASLNFDCKQPPHSAPDSLVPWYEHPCLKLEPEQSVIFGHWAALQGKTSNKQCQALDTGFIWGGSMTLFELTTGRRFITHNRIKSKMTQ